MMLIVLFVLCVSFLQPCGALNQSDVSTGGYGGMNLTQFDGIRIPGCVTNYRPSAVVVGGGSSATTYVCWNNLKEPNSIWCSSSKDMNSWTAVEKWVQPKCKTVEVQGVVAMAASTATTGTVDGTLYMYAHTSDSQVAAIRWFKGVINKPVCIADYIWFDFQAFNAPPSALYVEKTPYGPSAPFVMVVTQNSGGYIQYVKDYPSGSHTAPQDAIDTNGNKFMIEESVTMVQNGDQIYVFYTKLGEWPMEVWRTIFSTGNNQWTTPNKLTSTTGYDAASFPWITRMSPKDTLCSPAPNSLYMMMWPKQYDSIVVDKASLFSDLTWTTYDDTGSDKPGSSCSEITQMKVGTGTYTVCFYRGAREDGIWYSGYVCSQS